MAWEQRRDVLAILRKASSRNRAWCSTMEPALKRDYLLSAGQQSRDLHSVLVSFGARVDEERFGERLGCNFDELLRSASARVVVHEVRIEDQTGRLIRDGLNDSGMRVP